MRLFLAAELPEPVAGALAEWCPRDDGLRPVARESLHVTLAFLGQRGEDEAPAIAGLLEPAARPVRALALERALALPRRRPRVLAVELADGDGALAELQGALVRALAEAIGFVPERRAFLPHVTVARLREPRTPSLRELPECGVFAAASLTLFRSHLSPRGARYEALARAPL